MIDALDHEARVHRGLVLLMGRGMGARQTQKSRVGPTGIHSTRLQVVLYSFLLVATPFILLQNFLVEWVGKTSGRTILLAGLRIPAVPLIALAVVGGLLYLFRSRVSKRLFIAAGIVIVMDTLAQQITDYYFGHRFYDLQQNWHYIAYGIFSFMVYRDLESRGYRLAKIQWITIAAALCFSCFDEAFQMHMSARVFDPCDIAKDCLGCTMGMVLIALGGVRSPEFLQGMRGLRRTSWTGYFRNPFSTLALISVIVFVFLNVASLLSEFEYIKTVVLITLSLGAVLLLLLYLGQSRIGRYGLLGLAILVIGVQGVMLLRHRQDNIHGNRFGLTLYRGMAIPLFDVMIRPDGSFRLMDKKHFFNLRDQDFIMKRKSDIVIIGSGAYGKGGQGFLSTSMSQFMYNKYTGRATQIIILKSPEACREFNRLKLEHKNVALILHNTC
jgi:hypothetical protein